MVLILHENVLDKGNPQANKHDLKVLEDALEKPVRLGRSRDVDRHHDGILEYVPAGAQNKHHVGDGAPPTNVKHERLLYGRPDFIDCIRTLSPRGVPIRMVHFGEERSAKIISKIINQLVQLCAHSYVAGFAWRVHCFVVSSGGSSWGRGDTFFAPKLESGSEHCLW